MGDRSHIIVTSKEWDTDLDLYGHWAGEDNVAAVTSVLAMSDARVGDPSYLAAQLFYRFTTDGGYQGSTGFGVSPIAKDANLPDLDANADTVVINADDGTWRTVPARC